MSVNIDIRGEGLRPTLKTSRMSVYLSDTGSTSASTSNTVSSSQRPSTLTRSWAPVEELGLRRREVRQALLGRPPPRRPMHSIVSYTII